ncbi:MAG: hypothetical protein WCF98_12945 [Synechococcus sp. ELA057]
MGAPGLAGAGPWGFGLGVVDGDPDPFWGSTITAGVFGPDPG